MDRRKDSKRKLLDAVALAHVTAEFQAFEKVAKNSQRAEKLRPALETFRGWLIAGWRLSLPENQESMSHAQKRCAAHVANNGADLTPRHSWFAGEYKRIVGQSCSDQPSAKRRIYTAKRKISPEVSSVVHECVAEQVASFQAVHGTDVVPQETFVGWFRDAWTQHPTEVQTDFMKNHLLQGFNPSEKWLKENYERFEVAMGTGVV